MIGVIRRGAIVVAVLATTLVWGGREHMARASINPDEAHSSEVSAGEQLGLIPSEGLPWEFTQLTQTVSISSAGDELFGFDRRSRTLASGGCQTPSDKGYLGFRPPGGRLRLIDRLGGLATAPVIGADREAVVDYTNNCKQRSALPNQEPLGASTPPHRLSWS